MISEKNILLTDFDVEKYRARKYLTQKMSCTERKKNVSHVAPLYVAICLGKTKTKSPIFADLSYALPKPDVIQSTTKLICLFNCSKYLLIRSIRSIIFKVRYSL